MFEIDKLHIIFKVHLCVSYFILILGFIKMHTNQIQNKNSYNNLIILYLFIVVLPVILYQYYFECYCCKLK